MLAPKKLRKVAAENLPSLAPPIRTGAFVQERRVYLPLSALTEARLCDWIAGAAVGESIQYHEGLLLRDRSEISSPYSTRERTRIHAVARRAWIACELGLVHLFSLKLADCHYRYIAVRSTSRLTPAEVRERSSSQLKPPEIRARLRGADSAPHSNPQSHATPRQTH